MATNKKTTFNAKPRTEKLVLHLICAPELLTLTITDKCKTRSQHRCYMRGKSCF